MSSTIIDNNMGFRPADFDRGRLQEQSPPLSAKRVSEGAVAAKSLKESFENASSMRTSIRQDQAATFEPSASLQAKRSAQAKQQEESQAMNEEMAAKNEDRMEENQEKMAELTQNMQELANMIQANDLSFRRDENSDTIVMVLIDKETEEEVRQIPSELLLKIASRINEFISESSAKNEGKISEVNDTTQQNRDKRIDAYLNMNRMNQAEN